MAFTVNFEIFTWSCQFKDLGELIRTNYFVRLASRQPAGIFSMLFSGEHDRFAIFADARRHVLVNETFNMELSEDNIRTALGGLAGQQPRANTSLRKVM